MRKEWPEAAAYKNRTVLVTGGSGFIGANLSDALVRAGAKVRIFDSRRLHPRKQVSAAPGGARLYIGDIRDPGSVEDAVAGCEVIFNLAGKAGAAASNAAPMDDLDVNVTGQLNFLECCRRINPEVKIVFPSSRLVYRPTDILPVNENSPLGPLSIYGIHKLAAEHYHLLYSRLCGMRTVILRITNPYGPAGLAETPPKYGVINWLIGRAMAGHALLVYGDGRQLRDYIHIDDLVRCFLVCGTDSRADGRIFNVGGGTAASFVAVANMIVTATGKGHVAFVEWPKDVRVVETGSFFADISLIRNTIGWQPSISLEKGLADVIESLMSFPAIGVQ